MILRTLEYLEAIYKYKSFTKAAEVLFISQPAISAAIHSLEKELGIELMIRNPRVVKFTEIGEIFILKMIKVLTEIRQIEAEMKDYNSNTKKVLRLGVVGQSSIACIHEYLYNDFLPNLSINEIVYVDEDSTYNHIEKIKDDLLDICFNGIPNDIDCTMFETIPLISTEIYLIVNKNDALARHKKVSLEMIKGINFATMSEDSLMFKYFNDKCKEMGIYYHEISRLSNISSYVRMVSAGVCAGIIATNKSNGKLNNDVIINDSLAILPFDNPINVNIGFLYKKNNYLNQLAKRFIQIVERNISQKFNTE